MLYVCMLFMYVIRVYTSMRTPETNDRREKRNDDEQKHYNM